MFKVPNINEKLEKSIIQSFEEEANYIIDNRDFHTLLEWELANGIILLIGSLREVWKQQQST